MGSLQLGEPHQIGNAHFIPIHSTETEKACDYITANEALEKRVLELRDSGRIEAVFAINSATVPVLIIAGMDVHAEGTQSRIIIGSHLVPPKSKIEIPCRCTHDVHPIRRYHSIMTDVEHYSVAAPGVRGLSIAQSVAAQDRVWAKVQQHREKLKSRGVAGKPLLDKMETSSRLSDVQKKAAQALRDELAQVTPQSNQIGLAVISEGQVQTIEIFDSTTTYQRFHKNLLERFAYEIAAPKATSKKKVTALQQTMLKELQGISQQLDIKRGKGTAQSKGKILGTLQDQDHKLVHLCLEQL